MKKTFQVIGIITLLIGSFIYTEEVSMTSKLSDSLLNEIKEKSSNYKINSIQAIVNDNTIIPGINGKKVDVKKSYEKMKEIGYFNEKLLVYKDIKVKNLLNDNTDKYIISGNTSKKRIALLFKVDNNDNINDIVNILDNKKVKGTFFINSGFLENNHNLVIKLLQNNYTVGNLSNNEDYSDSDFIWMKTILTSSKYQKYNYCYVNKPNEEVLKICHVQNSYTIMTDVITNRPFNYVKSNLKSGKIFYLKINNETKNELENIINYVSAKGYEVVSLEKLLDEGI